MDKKKVCGFLLGVLLCMTAVITDADNNLDQLLARDQTIEPTKPEKMIELDHNRQNDLKIKKRLQQIYSEFNGLEKLRVSVKHGVVTLKGNVGSKAVEQKALQFATQMEDVIEVENNLTMTHSVNTRLNTLVKKLHRSGGQLLNELPLFLLAIAIICIFWLAGDWLSKRKNLYRKLTVNFFIADVLGKLVHLLFIILGIILALSLLDATAMLGTILGAAGIFGLALSFAVRDTVENFIASLLLSIRNPFEVNDVVEIEGFHGSVVRLTSRATILMSFDGNHVRIPNSTVFKAVIINFTRKPKRRFEFDVGVGCHENLGHVQEILTQTLINMESIMSQPLPMVIVNDFGDSNVGLRIYAWVNQNEYSFLKVRSEAIKKVKRCLEEAGISIPNPIYDLNLFPSNSKPDKELDQEASRESGPGFDDDKVDVAADNTIKEDILEENLQHSEENLLVNNVK